MLWHSIAFSVYSCIFKCTDISDACCDRRLYSVDEAQVNQDQTTASKSNVEKGIFLPPSVDNGDILATKSGGKITIVAGSRADGHCLPPCFIFDAPVDPAFLQRLPHSSLIDPNTMQHLQATYFINRSGGMEKGLFADYFVSNIKPALVCNIPSVNDIATDSDEDDLADEYQVAADKVHYAKFNARLDALSSEDDSEDEDYLPCEGTHNHCQNVVQSLFTWVRCEDEGYLPNAKSAVSGYCSYARDT